MKIITYIFVFFLSFSCVAQLSVRNNAYLFVNDQILFVEDDVNINEATSTIYLRNDAQLIQGSGTTGNNGLGTLSLQQNGDANAYMYNYWGSPVGNPSLIHGNDNFRASLLDESTGLITSTDALFTTDLNGSTAPLTISNRWFYTFAIGGLGYSEWARFSENEDIIPGLGFTMKGNPSGDQTYDFRGKPNNGEISVAVGPYDWTLVGNPYPSALDTVSFIHDVENIASITGTLYFWEQDPLSNSHNMVDYKGGYATFTIDAMGLFPSFVSATFDSYNVDGTLNVSGSASTSGKQVYRYLPIGQGFMVEGDPLTTGTVKFKNSHRAYYKESDPESAFFRANTTNEDGFPSVPDDYKRFRLFTSFDETYTRELLMNFHPTATPGFDYGLEGKTPGGVTTDAYWLTDTNYLVIQALEYNEDLAIPFGFYVNSNQAINFRLDDIQNFDTGTPIYLHDKELDIYTNLKDGNFEINLPSGWYGDRFEIVFKQQSTLSEEDYEKDAVGIVQINSKSELAIFNPNRDLLSSLEIYDTKGSLIQEVDINEYNNEFRLSTSHFNTGMYVVKLTLNDAQKMSRKVIIRN